MPEVAAGLAEPGGKNMVRQAEVGNGWAAKPGTDSEDKSVNKSQAEVSMVWCQEASQGPVPEGLRSGVFRRQTQVYHGNNEGLVMGHRSWRPLSNDLESCSALNEPLGTKANSNMHAHAHAHTHVLVHTCAVLSA